MANEKIATLLKCKRRECNLSVPEVIEALAERGITIKSSTLYGYENSVTMPNVTIFLALCQIYGIADVMSEVGLNISSKYFVEWDKSQYNDFFNGSLLEKIYMLLHSGIPSFDGYQDRFDEAFPKDADTANYELLWKIFSSMSEAGQGEALTFFKEMKEMDAKRSFKQPMSLHQLLSENEAELIAAFRVADPADQDAVKVLLSKYKPASARKNTKNAVG